MASNRSAQPPASEAAWSRSGLHSKQSVSNKQDESKQNKPSDIPRSNVHQFGQHRLVDEDSRPHTITVATLGAMATFGPIQDGGGASRKPPRRDGGMLSMAQVLDSDFVVSRPDGCWEPATRCETAAHHNVEKRGTSIGFA
jgi:hypothetical protein